MEHFPCKPEIIPKVLPCLHRSCTTCLLEEISGKTKLRCPECKEEHQIPESGVEGFKDDSLAESLGTIAHLRESIQQEPEKVCIDCTEKKEATTYCFACKGFICQCCNKSHTHRNNNTQRMIVSVTDLKSKKLTEMISFQEPPRCHIHPERVTDFYCVTCKYLPICKTCSKYGDHKNHSTSDVQSLAVKRRNELADGTGKLQVLEEHMSEVETSIAESRNAIKARTSDEMADLLKIYEGKQNSVNARIVSLDDKFEQQKSKMKIQLEKEKGLRYQKLLAFINQAREGFEKECEEEKRIMDIKIQTLEREKKTEQTNLQQTLESIRNELNAFVESLETYEADEMKKVEDIRDKFYNLKKRFKAVTSTVACIREANDVRINAFYIFDTCAAISSLVDKVEGELPELQQVSDQSAPPHASSPTETENQPVDDESDTSVHVEEDATTGYFINESMLVHGMTGCGKDNFVVTGSTGVHSAITVINLRDKTQRGTPVKWTNKRYCDFLTSSLIVTAGQPYEIGVFDVRDSTYRKTNIPAVVSSWSLFRNVSCIAADPDKNNMLVGGYKSRNVFVFDTNLNYVRTINLPTDIKWPRDITLHAGNLLVCDYDGSKAFAVTRSEDECRVLYTFPGPGLGTVNWWPCSVCTDMKGSVYILWGRNYIIKSNRRIVAQYSPDVGQLLSTRAVDSDAWSITTVESDGGERLLVATWGKRVVFRYDIENHPSSSS